MAALRTPGELAEEQWLLQELHLALDWALRRPPVLVEHWAGGRIIIQYGGGAGHPYPILPDPRGRRGISMSSPASQHS